MFFHPSRGRPLRAMALAAGPGCDAVRPESRPCNGVPPARRCWLLTRVQSAGNPFCGVDATPYAWIEIDDSPPGATEAMPGNNLAPQPRIFPNPAAYAPERPEVAQREDH